MVIEEVDAPFSVGLLAVAESRPDVVVLSADLSKYTDILPFAERHPDRFIQLGMAEQNMMGVAGGLAKTGLVPIAVTYGVFATRRACEQIQMALATGPRRPAVVVAFLPGVTTPFRATHQAIDDLSIMRAVPGMTVIDPADATEMEAVLAAAIVEGGPVYVRGLRGRVRRVLDPETHQFEIGRSYELRSGSSVGIISTGLATQWALEVADAVGAEGVEVGLLHVPTIKPFDAVGVAAFATNYSRVIAIENHSVVGGLGSAVAEVLAESGSPVRLERKGVPDAWPPAGELEFIRREIKLDRDSLVEHVLAPRSIS